MTTGIASSISRNTMVLAGSQIVTWTSTFILMLFLPRYLGSVEYGRLYLAISVVTIFLIVVDFGSTYSIAKEVSRSPEIISRIVVNSIAMRIVLWVFSMAALVAFSFIVGYSSVVRILMLIFGIQMLWEGARRVLWSCFQGLEKMQYPSLGGIVERVFITVVGVSALLLGAKSIVIGSVMVLGALLNFVVCVKYALPLVSTLPAFEWNEAMRFFKLGIPYFLWTIFEIIYYRVDAVMLSLMTPESVVGWYGASYRFFDLVMVLPSIVGIAVFPILSRLAKERETLALTTRKSLDFILITGVPIGIGIFAFSDKIVQLFYGLEGYGPSVVILRILSAGILFVYVDMILGTAILGCDKQRQWSVTALFAIFVNVALNYFMIPYSQKYLGNGGIGAAVATIITELFVMICAIFLLHRDALENWHAAVFLKVMIAGLLMAGSLWLIPSGEVFWIVQAIACAAVYIISLLLLKTLEPSELKFIRDSFSVRQLKNTLALRRNLSM
jgi:O-antigen/teichoic acid export membrane protein